MTLREWMEDLVHNDGSTHRSVWLGHERPGVDRCEEVLPGNLKKHTGQTGGRV